MFTIILVFIVIGLTLALINYVMKSHELQAQLRKNKALIWDWYMYLNDKQNSEHFSLWRKEMDE